MLVKTVLTLTAVFLQLNLTPCTGSQSSDKPGIAFMNLPPFPVRFWPEDSEMSQAIGLPLKYCHRVSIFQQVFGNLVLFETKFYKESNEIHQQKLGTIKFVAVDSDQVFLPTEAQIKLQAQASSSEATSNSTGLSLEQQSELLVIISVWTKYVVFPEKLRILLKSPEFSQLKPSILTNQSLLIRCVNFPWSEDVEEGVVGLSRLVCRYLGIETQEYGVATSGSYYCQIITNCIVSPCLMEFKTPGSHIHVIFVEKVIMIDAEFSILQTHKKEKLIIGGLYDVVVKMIHDQSPRPSDLTKLTRAILKLHFCPEQQSSKLLILAQELETLKVSVGRINVADLVYTLNITVYYFNQDSASCGSFKLWHFYTIFGPFIASSYPTHPCANFEAKAFASLFLGASRNKTLYKNVILAAFKDAKILSAYQDSGIIVSILIMSRLDEDIQILLARNFSSSCPASQIMRWILGNEKIDNPDLLRILLTEFREKMDWQTDRLFLQELWGNYENKMMSYFNWAENFAIVKRMHHVIRDIFPDRVAELAAGNRDSQLFLIFFQLFDPQFTLPKIIEFRKRKKDTLLRLECVLSVLEFSEALFLPQQYLKRLSLAENVVAYALRVFRNGELKFDDKLAILMSFDYFHILDLLLKKKLLSVDMAQGVLKFLEAPSIHPQSLAILLSHMEKVPIAIPPEMTLAPACLSIFAIFNSLGGKELVEPCRAWDPGNFGLSSSLGSSGLRQVLWDLSAVSQHSEALWSMDKAEDARERFGGMVIRSFLLLSLGIPFEETVFSDGIIVPKNVSFSFEEYIVTANMLVDRYCLRKKTTVAVNIRPPSANAAFTASSDRPSNTKALVTSNNCGEASEMPRKIVKTDDY